MNDKDWEAKFEMLFAEDLIQIDDDFFDEELCFNDPNDLIARQKELIKGTEIQVPEYLGKFLNQSDLLSKS